MSFKTMGNTGSFAKNKGAPQKGGNARCSKII